MQIQNVTKPLSSIEFQIYFLEHNSEIMIYGLQKE